MTFQQSHELNLIIPDFNIFILIKLLHLDNLNQTPFKYTDMIHIFYNLSLSPYFHYVNKNKLISDARNDLTKTEIHYSTFQANFNHLILKQSIRLQIVK